jgi:hypothetical protein
MILALCKSCGTLFEDNFVHNTISLKILPEREIDFVGILPIMWLPLSKKMAAM